MKGKRLVFGLLLMTVTACSSCSPEVEEESCFYSTENADWYMTEIPYDISAINGNVLYVRAKSNAGPLGLYIVDTSGHGQPQLLRTVDHGELYGLEARLSPDGQKLVWTAGDVFIRDIQTGTEEQLTFTYGNVRGADISPDGKYLVYASPFSNPGDSLEGGIVVLNLETRSAQRVRGLVNQYPVKRPLWSPDGLSISFLTDEPEALHVFTLRDSSEVDVSRTVNHSGVFCLGWISENRSLVFHAYTPLCPFDGNDYEFSSTDGGVRELSVRLMPWNVRAVVSRDGQMFAHVDVDSSGTVGVIYIQSTSDLQGITKKRLTTWKSP